MWWNGVDKKVLFYDDKNNKKHEDMHGANWNQFESTCDLLAQSLEKRWNSKVKWKVISDANEIGHFIK